MHAVQYNRIEFKVGSTLMHFYDGEELIQEKNFYDIDADAAKNFEIMIFEGRSFAPVFALMESGFFYIEGLFFSDTNQSQIKLLKQDDNDLELILTTGTNEALLNGEIIYLEQPIPDTSQTIAAVFPIRFIFETFGCKVDWDNDRRVVIVHLPQ